ncbi:MAG: urease accessory protein UreF [Burkholderiales bacterium]|nr:urease accessory protein UreF [Burkholderiales bacterium]PZN05727.1 MAG: urease accessory protein UreF [Pseudomonadota bacterium]
MTTAIEALPLLRLLQLSSPALPVGAYSYSQGLEWAVEDGTVRDAATAQRWIGDVLRYTMGRFEAPVWLRLHAAWQRDDLDAVAHWNARFLASRESAELRAETLQMGYSLRALLRDLRELDVAPLDAFDALCYPTAAAFAAARWRIDAQAGLVAYLWAWAENLAMAALKAVPLGQVAGQRMLSALLPALESAAREAATLADAELSNFAPGLAMASSLHETQYSRLFRS